MKPVAAVFETIFVGIGFERNVAVRKLVGTRRLRLDGFLFCISIVFILLLIKFLFFVDKLVLSLIDKFKLNRSIPLQFYLFAAKQ